MVVPLPPPQPSLALRFATSASFSILALGLLPVFLSGMLLRALGLPLIAIYERMTARPKQRKAKAQVVCPESVSRGVERPMPTSGEVKSTTATTPSVRRSPAPSLNNVPTSTSAAATVPSLTRRESGAASSTSSDSVVTPGDEPTVLAMPAGTAPGKRAVVTDDTKYAFWRR